MCCNRWIFLQNAESICMPWRHHRYVALPVNIIAQTLMCCYWSMHFSWSWEAYFNLVFTFPFILDIGIFIVGLNCTWQYFPLIELCNIGLNINFISVCLKPIPILVSKWCEVSREGKWIWSNFLTVALLYSRRLLFSQCVRSLQWYVHVTITYWVRSIFVMIWVMVIFLVMRTCI